jgi:hypothetical protein
VNIIYSSADLSVIDNFLPAPDKLLSIASRATFGPYVGQDGVTYERVSEHVSGQVVDALNEFMGRPIKMLGMGFRLNYAGENPNHSIHADLGWGKYALVLYLSEPEIGLSGTAFWNHTATGRDRILTGEFDLLTQIEGDWDDVSKWNQTQFIASKFNRASIYKSELFHSRWPFEAYGSSIADGRLICVCFFN